MRILITNDDGIQGEGLVHLTRWAMIACDQYTSQPEVWLEAEKIAGDAPSTLRMAL